MDKNNLSTKAYDLIRSQNFEQRLNDRVRIDSARLGLADDLVRLHGHEGLQLGRSHEQVDPQVAVTEDVLTGKENVGHC